MGLLWMACRIASERHESGSKQYQTVRAKVISDVGSMCCGLYCFAGKRAVVIGWGSRLEEEGRGTRTIGEASHPAPLRRGACAHMMSHTEQHW